MLEAYEYSAWDHTASLLTCVTGLVKKGVKIDDFHPYRRYDKHRPVSAQKALQSLKGVLPAWKDPVN